MKGKERNETGLFLVDDEREEEESQGAKKTRNPRVSKTRKRERGQDGDGNESGQIIRR